jgi:L-cysteine:1D-myo-inositol 2-amino-2-deoxy-alpha-D-glucopyranoside ligase
MRLYDTQSQRVNELEFGDVVTMYSCGITPYDSAHLGHAFVYLTFDMIARRVRDLGKEARVVRNVTDVDDDILRKARSLGVNYLDLAAGEMAKFDRDMRLLNLLPVYTEPRATGAIPEILSLIGELFDAGCAYENEGWVYFDHTKFKNFGQVSHRTPEEMLVLAAEHGGNPTDPLRRHPLDFVMWQPSLSDEPAWESRWGAGRPGWHIECSAISMRDLGPTLDIHGGGRDLAFPHHECEAAQSEAATGVRFVKTWTHVGLVGYEGTKMSKSLGNLVFVEELAKQSEPDAVRLALLDQHYRQDWEWTNSLLTKAQSRLATWRSTMASTRTSSVLDDVRAALDDDLNTPGAVSAIDQAAAAGVHVASAAALLGITL